MRHESSRATLISRVGIGCLVLGLGAFPGLARGEDDAHAAAVKALDAGAAMFDARDAKGLAATYLDDAVLTVVTRDSSTKELKKEVKYGRTQIEEYYQTLIKPDSTFHAKNQVEFAKFGGADILLVGGKFSPDGNSLSIPFVQVRVKQGDTWKIMNMQVFFAPND